MKASDHLHFLFYSNHGKTTIYIYYIYIFIKRNNLDETLIVSYMSFFNNEMITFKVNEYAICTFKTTENNIY